MNFSRFIGRKILLAVVGGVVSNAIYFGLLFTQTLHGFAVGALGPAIDIVNRYIDPTFSAGSYRYVLEFAVNIALYTAVIFVVLLLFHMFRLFTDHLRTD